MKHTLPYLQRRKEDENRPSPLSMGPKPSRWKKAVQLFQQKVPQGAKVEGGGRRRNDGERLLRGGHFFFSLPTFNNTTPALTDRWQRKRFHALPDSGIQRNSECARYRAKVPASVRTSIHLGATLRSLVRRLVPRKSALKLSLAKHVSTLPRLVSACPHAEAVNADRRRSRTTATSPSLARRYTVLESL